MAFFVTTTDDTVADDGEISLRDALEFARLAPGADTIKFAIALSGQTITLSGASLFLSSDVTIDGDINGDNVSDITISGNDASRMFNATGGTITLDALAITGGLGGL